MTARPARGTMAGFTLIELAVVLAILGLAAGLVLPSVGRTTDSIRARSEVAAVGAFLRHARELAITGRETHAVRLDPDAQALLLTGRDPKVVKASRVMRPPARIELVSRGAHIITFMPEGRSSGGAFLVESPGRRVYQVSVDPLSGRVTNRRVES